jgi:hypothetical protein
MRELEVLADLSDVTFRCTQDKVFEGATTANGVLVCMSVLLSKRVKLQISQTTASGANPLMTVVVVVVVVVVWSK